MTAHAAWRDAFRRAAERIRRTCGGTVKDGGTDASGRWGEALAARLLLRRGMRILGRRVRIGRRDEIDLVLRDGAALVFVEVKTRRSEDFGRPIETVDRNKRLHLSRAALAYLRRLRRQPDFIRFDVVEVVGQPGDAAPVVRHIPNAFPLEGRLRFPG